VSYDVEGRISEVRESGGTAVESTRFTYGDRALQGFYVTPVGLPFEEQVDMEGTFRTDVEVRCLTFLE